MTAAPAFHPSAPRLALRSILSVALLFGAAHTALAQEDGAQGRMAAEPLKADAASAVERGEAAVARAPQDATLRAELGHAYLRAGRFESAAAALTDALALGGPSDRVTLTLALAQIACGQNRAALATLDHGAGIAPADLGLALALASDPGRGIAVLTDAVRDGPASPNLRQNLAYAYALDGRWADATVTAGFDLPPDQVNARLQQWAETMQSGGERSRVARLLNVPLTSDQGMPAALALNIPPVNSGPVLATAQAEAAGPPPPAVALTSPKPAPVVVAAVAPVFVATPVVQAVAYAPAPAPARELAVRAQGANPNSGHFVQLAAYHNQRDAERGKLILAKRHALLRGHGLLVTEMMIHGRSYWRVVMAGFDGATALNMCSSLRRQGAACFAYSIRPGQALALANKSGSRLATR